MANEKAKYWTAVLYPENMIDNWQDEIGSILQFPVAYCIHDKDTLNDSDSQRSTHVHVILALNNTTTYNHAFSMFQELNASGKIAVNKIERVKNIRYCYDYLIHDTDDCRKKGKHQYDTKERILINNFDIGCFEQVSIEEKRKMVIELCDLIVKEEFINITDFYMYVISNFDTQYLDLFCTYSGLFERLTKGNFQRLTK